LIGKQLTIAFSPIPPVSRTMFGISQNCWQCEVFGITSVESVQQAQTFKVPLGTILYTVEFADGSDALVPEVALEAL
jgi:hypothetical protein